MRRNGKVDRTLLCSGALMTKINNVLKAAVHSATNARTKSPGSSAQTFCRVLLSEYNFSQNSQNS